MADQNTWSENKSSDLSNNITLPDGYYLYNFSFLLNFVESRYRDLLSENEVGFIQSFGNVSEGAQRLYVRLVLRKGPLFRSDKLNYAEIKNLNLAAFELRAVGLLDVCCPIDAGVEEQDNLSEGDELQSNLTESLTDNIDALLSLLTKPELVDLLKSNLEFENSPAQINKTQLLETGNEHLSVSDFRKAINFDVYQPLGVEHLELLKLLFFGNMYQDFTEFVLNDLGITPFEQYIIDQDTRFFSKRDIVDDTIQLYYLNELSLSAIESNDLVALLQVAEMVNLIDEPSLQRRKDKVINRIARQLERLEQYHDALRLFSFSQTAPARERRTRIYHSALENAEQALVSCNEIISNPEDEAEFEFAVKFGKRILKKNKLPIPAHYPNLKTIAPQLNTVELEFDPQYRVEEVTRQWYVNQGHQSAYVENALFTGIFGLAFWDIIFGATKGVFFNPCQRGPVDLFSSDFTPRRQAAITVRLQELESDHFLRRKVLDTFNKKQGLANILVNWHVLNRTLLALALERIPVKHLCSVFERLLADLRSNRSGLPDLIVFPDTGGYQLVEVKGPGDKLQDNQNRWIRHFECKGLPIVVVNVKWI
ncbi:MAG: hypothetical protein ACJAVI_001324 [Candidatus Azotimanducaceae bacterium]